MFGKEPKVPHTDRVVPVSTEEVLYRYPTVRGVIIREIKRTGSLALAAHRVMLRPHVITAHMRINPDFAQDVEAAMEFHHASIEAEIRRRGMDGWLEPKFSNRGKIGEVRRYSDPMLALYAKRHIPAYRAADTGRMELEAQVKLEHRIKFDPSGLRPEQRRAMRILLGSEPMPGDEEIPSTGLNLKTVSENRRNGNGVNHGGATGMGDGEPGSSDSGD